MKKALEGKVLVPAILAVIVVAVIGAVISMSLTGMFIGEEEVDEFAELEQRFAMLYEEAETKTRPLYFPESIQSKMFGELPAMPDDFYQTVLLYRYNKIDYDPEKIGPEYWKQPEWFADYETTTIPVIKGYDPDRTSIWCLGLYPKWHVIRVKTEETEGKGYDEAVTWTWLRSAPLANRYYGVQLQPAYPEIEKMEEIPKYGQQEISVVQDPEVARNYIEISLDPAEPFVLSPNFPIYKPGYLKQIQVDVKINAGIPEGWYVVGFDAGPPPKEFTEDHVWKHRMQYTDPNVGMACSNREFRVFINVV